MSMLYVFVYRFFKNLDYVDPAKAAIWGWVNILILYFVGSNTCNVKASFCELFFNSYDIMNCQCLF